MCISSCQVEVRVTVIALKPAYYSDSLALPPTPTPTLNSTLTEANGRLSMNGEIACALQSDSHLLDSYSSAASQSHPSASSPPAAPVLSSSFTDNPIPVAVAASRTGDGGGGSGSGASGGTTAAATKTDGGSLALPQQEVEEEAVRRTLPGLLSAPVPARGANENESATRAASPAVATASSAQKQQQDSTLTGTAAEQKAQSPAASGSAASGRASARVVQRTERGSPPVAATAIGGGRAASGRARRSLWFYLVPSVLFALLLFFVALVFLLETDLLPADVLQSSPLTQLDQFYRPYRSRFLTMLGDL